MRDWTSQKWTKRDGRNNQEQQEQQQEKKATYKTAAELAVKKRRIRLQQSWQSKSSNVGLMCSIDFLFLMLTD